MSIHTETLPSPKTGSKPRLDRDPAEPAERLAIAWWPTDRPTPFARNARVCPESAIAKVAASVTEFGWRQPIVVDEAGVILAGHTRLLAAQRLGLAEVPAHVATGLSCAQAKAYRLMDNRAQQETSWDEGLLGLELAELAGLEIDLDLSGFEPFELASLLAEPDAGLTDPDEVPPPPEEPFTRPGDLWLLGDHRLLCGDATDREDVERLMAGRRATLMTTDPPYLADYSGGAHPASEANGAPPARTNTGTPTSTTNTRWPSTQTSSRRPWSAP